MEPEVNVYILIKMDFCSVRKKKMVYALNEMLETKEKKRNKQQPD